MTLINHKIAHLILAAGGSRRMGTPKQLLPWKNTSLIGWEVEKAMQLETVDTYVILGANIGLIRQEVATFGVSVLYHKDWQLGIGSTISFGVKHIIDHQVDYDSVLITLVDQPLIPITHIHSLLGLSRQYKTKIIATGIKDIAVVPAIFPQFFFKELVALTEDYGARYILKKYTQDVLCVAGTDTTDDIDTIAAYYSLQQREEG